MKPNPRKLIRRVADLVREHPRVALSIALVGIALVCAGAGFAIGTWRNICVDCPSIAQLYVWEPRSATKVFAANDELIDELAEQRRTPVEIESLPDYVPHAFVAVEDKRFYRHEGIDPIGIARAMVDNIRHMEIVGGGSTITQQLARNMFEQRIGFRQVFRRKLKEAKVARAIEQVYTKDEILQAYINQINYAYGVWGIEAAAQHFFGKRAADVNQAEAALLAAVINSPGDYSPFRHPERARNRRNIVLASMADQGYLDAADARRWMAHPLPESPPDADRSGLAPYFVEWVRGMLDDRYGSDLYRQGLQIYTTLDPEMQRLAEEAMRDGWRNIEIWPPFDHPTYEETMASDSLRELRTTPYVQGTFIAMDARTGEVKAMIGGRDFSHSQFNRATQARRQPGSVFKPFVYTAAIESDIPPSYVIQDAPIVLQVDDTTRWAPSNYTDEFHGATTLREALRLSINIVAVKLGQMVGEETIAQVARRMGIRTPIPRVPATAIGAASVIPIQVVEAYSTFATQGVRVTPRAIRRVENAEGRVLWEPRVERERVLDPLDAYLMRDMLRSVVDNGTAYSVRDSARGNVPWVLPIGGKTGTTNEFGDMWFVGFTPDLVAAVWFGMDRRQTIFPRAAGGVWAAPVWAQFIRGVYFPDTTAVAPGSSAGAADSTMGFAADSARREPLLPLPPPDVWARPPQFIERRIDRESGKLATEWCPLDQIETEIFLPGTEPTEACDQHGPGLFGAPLRRFVPDTAIPDSTRADTLADTLNVDRPPSTDTAAVDTLGFPPDTTGATAGAATAR